MTQPVRLPLAKVIWGAFAFPVMYPGVYFHAVGLPLLGVIGATLASIVSLTNIDGAVRGFTYALYLLSICWLAVRTHRLVLLGVDDARTPTAGRARTAISKYLGTMAVGWIGYVVITLLIITLLGMIFLSQYVPADAAQPLPGAVPPDPDPETQRKLDYLTLAASLVPMYLAARLILVLPAIALEQTFDLRAAWQRSRGNGWRLFAATLLLPRLMSHVLNVLGDFATSIVLVGAWVVLAAVVVSLEFIALSLCYRELAPPPAPPPTHPPA